MKDSIFTKDHATVMYINIYLIVIFSLGLYFISLSLSKNIYIYKKIIIYIYIYFLSIQLSHRDLYKIDIFIIILTNVLLDQERESGGRECE